MVCGSDAVLIPAAGPPLLALFASMVRGFTGFGDGIAFQSLWSIAAALSLMPVIDCYTMKKIVLYSTIMQALTMPLQVYQARRYLRSIFGYALMMGLIGGAFIAVGAAILLAGSNDAVRVLAGVVFCVYSSLQLISKALKHLTKRAQAAATSAATAEAAETGVERAQTRAQQDQALSSSGLAGTDSLAVSIPLAASGGAVAESGTGTAAGTGPAAAKEETTPAAASAPTAAPATLQAPTPWFSLQKLSPHYSPRSMFLLLIPASVLAGLLGGMFGAAGPPLISAYALLELDKEVLRGFGMVPSVFMVMRMAMYTASPDAVFAPSEEAGVYAAIVACAFVGSSVGNRMRSRLDTEMALILVLVITFVGSGTLLGLFRDAAVTVAYALLLALFAACFAFLWAKPSRVTVLLARATALRRKLQGRQHASQALAVSA
jgi:uncharacterized membrane protein YfcA